jgi:parallel beta-helix repeat protein
MTTTTFVQGTPIVPAWLNDVNTLVYGFPAQAGNDGKVLTTNGTTLSWATDATGGSSSTIFVDPRDVTYAGGATTARADNAAQFQAAFDYAKTNNAVVILPPGIYNVSKIYIENGVRGFIGGGGTLKLTNAANSGVLLAGPNQGKASAVNNFTMQGIRIDANSVAGPTVCVWADNAYDCRIIDNVIVNVSFGYGILFRNYTATGAFGGGNKIQRNKIFGTAQNTGGSQDWYGIYVDAEYVLGGASDEIDYWRKNFTDAPSTQNQSGYEITDNRISGGYYGIGLGHVTDSVISNNNIQNNGRGISVQHSCTRNVISGNRVFECYSSGIHLTYGSSFNNVVGNEVSTSVGVGEALIQAYIGCQYNKIEGNLIASNEATTGSQHGVYVAVNASYNTISNNTISGKYKMAGIGVASAWDATNNAGTYPYRYAAGGAGSNLAWMANATTTDIVIKGNTIRRGANTTPGILLDQCTTQAGVNAGSAVWNAAYTANYQAQLSNVTLENNVVLSTSSLENLRIYEDTSGKNTGHFMFGNRFSVTAGTHTRAEAATYFVQPRGRAHFTDTKNNFPYDDNVEAWLWAAGTTQDVSVGKYFSSVSAGGLVSTLTGGIDGQEIRVRLDSTTGITHTSGGGADTIRLGNGYSIPVGATDTDDWIELRRQGGVWFETSRARRKPTNIYLSGSITTCVTGSPVKVQWMSTNDFYGEMSSNVFTCKQPGIYAIAGRVHAANTPVYAVDEQFTLRLYKNGSQFMNGQGLDAQASGVGHNFNSTLSTTIELAAGDTIEFDIFCNWSGAGTPVLNGVAAANWATITRVV